VSSSVAITSVQFCGNEKQNQTMLEHNLKLNVQYLFKNLFFATAVLLPQVIYKL